MSKKGQAPENRDRTLEWEEGKDKYKPMPAQKIEDSEKTKEWEKEKEKNKK